jgi:glycosyltransferase involved in cell wall biosynthesis
MRENQSLDSLLVGSHAMRQELVKNGFPKENVHILAPVVRLTPIEPCVVPKEPNILYVGQLIRGKGVDLLLHALNQLDCDFTATIIGTGNAKAKLETLSQQLKLDEKVRFLGWVSHDDLSKYYSRSKVVAVPSRWPEPFGMIGLEAMLHGRPVIAFEVGGIPDWLEHEKSGLLVPEQDTKAFAEALQKLLSNTSLAAEFGENGRMIVKQCFGFEEYLDRLEAHLFGTPTDASKKTQTHSNDRNELS